MAKLLEAEGLVKAFGGTVAVDNVDFHINKGEILGLIGPNGAGKTTLFNLISGYVGMDAGVVRFDGKRISGRKPYHICHAGIARTFQASKNFPDMSVRENAMVGALFGSPGSARARADASVDEILAFVGLDKYADRPATDIPLAGRKKLEVARALATKPSVLMLDELMAGLNPAEVGEAMELVKRIRASGVTVLMIEHVMKAIMSICDRVIVLHRGSLIAEGAPDEIANNPQVIEVYLGGGEYGNARSRSRMRFLRRRRRPVGGEPEG
jgi:branched-chain amino acid transport system ATP-binding protein